MAKAKGILQRKYRGVVLQKWMATPNTSINFTTPDGNSMQFHCNEHTVPSGYSMLMIKDEHLEMVEKDLWLLDLDDMEPTATKEAFKDFMMLRCVGGK